MRARTWNLRMNLDTFNSGYAALDTDQERAEFVSGLYKGMNGGKVKDDCSDPMSVGFAIGEEMRREAEGFRERSVENGSKRKSNRNDQMVDHKVYQTVYQTCTQSTIHNPQSTIQQPEKASSPSRARSSRKKEKPVPPDDLLPFLEEICRDWPRRTAYKNNAGQWYEYNDVAVFARPGDLWERMVTMFPGEDYRLMINCGLVYLERIMERERQLERIPNVGSMKNFYGEKAVWKEWVAKVQEESR